MLVPTHAHLALLGAPTWHPFGAPPVALKDLLPSYLLGHLALRAEWISRDELVGLFWPDRPQTLALHNLRTNLHRLRAQLDLWGQGQALQAERRRVRLLLPTDWDRWRANVASADRAALAQAHGQQLFAGWRWQGFEAVQAWALSEQRAFHNACRRALHQQIQALQDSGQHADALELCLRGVQTDPLDEALVRDLLLAVAKAPGAALVDADPNWAAQALAAYDTLQAHLEHELAVQPAASTQAAAATLRVNGNPRPSPLPVGGNGGLQPVNARAEPVPPLGAGQASVPRAVLQPPALVGRQSERAELAHPGAALVGVYGAAGVGKTRLLEEAVPQARWLVCREGMAGVSLAPVVEHLQDFQDHLPDLGPYRRELARLLPSLAQGELLPQADPSEGKARLLLALAHVLEQGSPVLVVDDWQWADDTTTELIGLLVQRQRLAVRLAWRAHELGPAARSLRAAWETAGALRLMHLQELDVAQLGDLLHHLHPVGGDLAPLQLWLHQRTGGNVFLALQLLRSSFETGQLRAQGGAWQGVLMEALASSQGQPSATGHGSAGADDGDGARLGAIAQSVPERVAELLRLRLVGLSEATRRVMALAALRGHASEPERLAQAAGVTVWEVTQAVEEAQRRGFFKQDRFAHDLMRQVLLSSSSDTTRRARHAALATHFAPVLHPAQLAAHWWEADNEAAAVAATARAATLYCSQGLQAEAMSLLAKAMARVQPAWHVASPSGTTASRPAGPTIHSTVSAHEASARAAARATWAAHLGSWRATTLRELAEYDAAAAQAEEVLAWPAAPADRGRVLRVLSAVAIQQGRLDQAQVHLDEAELAAPDEPELLIDRAQLALLRGEIARWLPVLEQSLRKLRQLPADLHLIQLLRTVAAAYGEAGDPQRGDQLLEEAMALARSLNARHAQVDVAVNRVWSLAALGRNEEAISTARQALALGEYDSSAVLRNNLAWSLLELGRLDEARTEYELQAAADDPTLALGACAKLVEIHARQGDDLAKDRLLEGMAAAMLNTQVPVIHAAAAIAALRHGQPRHWQAVLAQLRPAPLDPWLRERLQNALHFRGLDSADYVVPPTDTASAP